jgi:hypothetical protein
MIASILFVSVLVGLISAQEPPINYACPDGKFPS